MTRDSSDPFWGTEADRQWANRFIGENSPVPGWPSVARLIATVRAAERERCARLCDAVTRNKRDYGPAERALARKLAEQMRGGGR